MNMMSRESQGLLETKQKFDPDGVFSAIPLPL
jgi:hypothetical protein